MYKIVVTDLNFVPQGEVLEASNFQYTRTLSKPATLSFQIPMEHTQLDLLVSMEGYIKLYRHNVLQYVGPIVSADENADRDTRTVAVTSADAAWKLSKRVVLGSANSTGKLWTTATARHTIAKAILDELNTAGGPSETGIDTSAIAFSSGSSITHKIEPYSFVLPSIQTLGGALDGFDWLVRARENWVNGGLSGVKYGNMELKTLIGTTKPNAVFEYGYGTRSNVLSYTKKVTRDQQCNNIYWNETNSNSIYFQPPQGAGPTADQTKWGYMDDVLSLDITDSAMRGNLLSEHIRVRRYPRVLIYMTPHIDPGDIGQVPEPTVDYDVGDIVPFRAVHAGKERFYGSVRVFGIKITVDPTGFERVELVLEEEAA